MEKKMEKKLYGWRRTKARRRSRQREAARLLEACYQNRQNIGKRDAIGDPVPVVLRLMFERK